MNVIIKLEYRTQSGKSVPLASSSNLSLARVVAYHILGELEELSRANFDDDVLSNLAREERDHIDGVFSALGLREEMGIHES